VGFVRRRPVRLRSWTGQRGPVQRSTSGTVGAAPDEPLPQEPEAVYDAAWATHSLRAHPRFRLARPGERENGTTLVVFVGRSTWVPGVMRTPRRSHGRRPRADAIAPVLVLTIADS